MRDLIYVITIIVIIICVIYMSYDNHYILLHRLCKDTDVDYHIAFL